MKVFHHPIHVAHEPDFFLVRGIPTASADQPERVDRLLAGVARVGLGVEQPPDFGTEPVAAVHTARYLDFLRDAHREWMTLLGPKAGEVVANIHPSRDPVGYPSGVVGRAGWHMADTACPIGPDTHRAALASANSAVSAAAAVAGGDRFAYGLCRPSGHHAFADMAGGFCFLNNAAIAAQWLRDHFDRVAMLDIDVHHGNGTQDIFYRRSDVLTISIHRDPTDYYPFFWGYGDQAGVDDGEGCNLNLPLAEGSGDPEFLSAVDVARERIRAFGAGVVVIALGLDAAEDDPLQGLRVTTPGFARIGRAIAELDVPTVFVQEGGYLCDALTDNLASFLTGVMSV
ncbi:MAG: histone deacetylase family protein [Acidimicrobiia bacterium]|nr:histone deacetylase family protein [Acidimicrobiia bacterium]